MDSKIKNIIKTHWRQMIDNCYFYRGMSLADLDFKSKIILNPRKNPLKNMVPLFIEYSEFLLNLIAKGLEFKVNDFYVEPLEKVLNWTIRDIQNPGIDFTTNYADAVAYASNYAGSQIKHNFNLITKTIHQCENQRCFNLEEKQTFRRMTKQIKCLLKQEHCAIHQSVVIKVKRSCKAFQGCAIKELNYGGYKFFFERITQEAKKNHSLSIGKIAFFLHQISQSGDFNIRLVKPLYQSEITEIIKYPCVR